MHLWILIAGILKHSVLLLLKLLCLRYILKLRNMYNDKGSLLGMVASTYNHFQVVYSHIGLKEKSKTKTTIHVIPFIV